MKILSLIFGIILISSVVLGADDTFNIDPLLNHTKNITKTFEERATDYFKDNTPFIFQKEIKKVFTDERLVMVELKDKDNKTLYAIITSETIKGVR